MIERVVGYFEYQRALASFDKLARLCTSEELAAINEIVSQYPEYAVFTNLSRRVQPRLTHLAEERWGEGDRFERRGLDWVMALARVELGAMLAQFTAHPEPFAAFPPTQFEQSAFVELIEDGARMHYWSLLNDEQFQAIPNRAPNGTTLAYARRLLMALRFVKAMSAVAEPTYSRSQREELAIWNNNLVNWNQAVVKQVRNYIRSLESQSNVNVDITQGTERFGQRCSDMCDQLTNELQGMIGQPVTRSR